MSLGGGNQPAINPYLIAAQLGSMTPGTPQYAAAQKQMLAAMAQQHRQAQYEGLLMGALSGMGARAPNGYPAPFFSALGQGVGTGMQTMANAQHGAMQQGLAMAKMQQAGTQQALARQKLQSAQNLAAYTKQLLGVGISNPTVAVAAMKQMGGDKLSAALTLQATQLRAQGDGQAANGMEEMAMLARTDPANAAKGALRIHMQLTPKAMSPAQEAHLAATTAEAKARIPMIKAATGYYGTARNALAQANLTKTEANSIDNSTKAVLAPLMPPKNAKTGLFGTSTANLPYPNIDTALAPASIHEQIAHSMYPDKFPPAKDSSGQPLPSAATVNSWLTTKPNSPTVKRIREGLPIKFDNSGITWIWDGRVWVAQKPAATPLTTP